MWKFQLLTLTVLTCICCAVQPVVAYDDSGTIAIKGTVAPKASAFSVGIDASSAGSVNQDEVITYTIRYTSNATSAGPLTLQAQWFKGTIDGAPTASVDLLSYEVKSATNAYGGVQPTIDLNARTITWTIVSMPTNRGEQRVTFKLKTSDAYTGSKRVVFPVVARITTPSGVPDSRVERVYEYKVPPTAEPTATPESTSTAESESDSSSEESGTADEFLPEITDIELVGISDTSAKVEFSTSKSIKTSIAYGKSATTLANSTSEEESALTHTLSMTNLQLGTRYYFRVYWLDGETKTAISDAFIFDTASQNQVTLDQPSLLTASQSWGIAYSLSPDSKPGSATMVAVTSSVLDLQFVIPNSKTIRTATVIVRPPKVLGVSTEESDAYQSNSTEATEIGQSMFVGKVKLPTESGTYDVVLKTEDIYGNLSEKKLAEVKVVKPWKILTSKQEALQGVSVLLYRYNEKTKVFDILPNTSTSLKNPVLSNADGVVDISLLPGKYKAQLTLEGYKSQELEFVVDPEGENALPTVIMESTGISVENSFLHLRRGSLLGVDSFWQTLVNIIRDKRLLYTRLIFLSMILPVLTWIALSSKLKVPVFRLPIYLFSRLRSLITHAKRIGYIKGTVLESGSTFPLRNVYVRLLSKDTHAVLRDTWTGERGDFHFIDLPNHSGFELRLSAYGYKSTSRSLAMSSQSGTYMLEPATINYVQLILLIMHKVVVKGIGFFLQIFLFVSAITGIVFVQTVGIIPALPFLVLTGLNILLWIYSTYVTYR